MAYFIEDNRDLGENDLEKAQLVMLKLLKVFANICEKHGLSYWLDAGTLLGAVRHKGFIPWDDDLDIGMPRKDYEIFKKIVKDELPIDVHYQIRNRRKGNRWRYIKLRDKYSTLIQHSEIKRNIKYHQGIFIDIFPYDYTSKSIKRMRLLLNRKYEYSDNPFVAKNYKLFNLLAIFPIRILGYKLLKKIMSKRIDTGNENYYQYGLEMNINYFKLIPEKYIFPLKELKFVDDLFYVPNCYDEYLKIVFGNYMQLPKEEDRITHAYALYPYMKCNHKDSLEWKTQN